MNQNGFRGLQLNIPGLGCWVTLLLGAWLLGVVGLGWLVKSALALVVVLLLLPVVLIAIAQFWLRRNVVVGECPVCGQGLNGLAPLQTTCPNCGTLLKTSRQGFERVIPDGTVEVQAVEVESTSPGTDPADSTVTLDVDARALPEADV